MARLKARFDGSATSRTRNWLFACETNHFFFLPFLFFISFLSRVLYIWYFVWRSVENGDSRWFLKGCGSMEKVVGG